MEKKYFKNMKTDEKLEIVLNNEKLKEKVSMDYYDELMRQQYEEGNLMLGNNHHKYIDIRDHYSSFYLVLRNWYEFVENVDYQYLNPEGITLYDEIIKLKEEFENTDDEDKYFELENILEEKCKDLLAICEKLLHEYEYYNEDDLKEYLKNEFEFNDLFSNYYILGNNKNKVYEDISYTKTYE